MRSRISGPEMAIHRARPTWITRPNLENLPMTNICPGRLNHPVVILTGNVGKENYICTGRWIGIVDRLRWGHE